MRNYGTTAPKRCGARAVWIYWVLCAIVLTGYAVAGRGFAYLPIGPIYIGELLLACGFITCLVLIQRGKARFKIAIPFFCAVALLFTWGLLRTFPNLPEHGLEALRDAATYGYSSFALIAFLSLNYFPNHIIRLTTWYGRFSAWFPFIGLAHLWIALSKPDLPTLGSGVPVIAPKGGDLGVHLASIVAFRALNLAGSRSFLVWVPVSISVFGLLASQRGGSLAFLAGMLVVCFARPGRQIAAAVCLILLVCITYGSLGLIGWSPPAFWHNRELTLDQVKANFLSLIRTDEELAGNLLATRAWRVVWWRKIVEYTFFGEYFWTGKGLGFPLGREDGVTNDPRLRSPHSIHMTYLARLGVPGLALWLVLNGLYCTMMLRAVFRARACALAHWERLSWWLIACWLASLVNASFDVYLEGPMGGIWFWTQLGVGAFVAATVNTLAAHATRRRRLPDHATCLAG